MDNIITLTCNTLKQELFDKLTIATHNLKNGESLIILYKQNDRDKLIQKIGAAKIISYMRNFLFTYYHRLWLYFDMITISPHQIEIIAIKIIYDELFLEYHHNKLILWAYTETLSAQICMKFAEAEKRKELLILSEKNIRSVYFDDMSTKNGPYSFFATIGQFNIANKIINNVEKIYLKIDKHKTTLNISI